MSEAKIEEAFHPPMESTQEANKQLPVFDVDWDKFFKILEKSVGG